MSYISTITLLVNDYDEALLYYTKVLNFELVEDTKISLTKRRVIVKPKNNDKLSTGILLVKANTEDQKDKIGNQVGEKVMIILKTDNFDRDYQKYKENGVIFMEEPRSEKYGKVVVFKDLYGNMFDLIG